MSSEIAPVRQSKLMISGRLSDIGMWALLNGRERDNDAWVTLFRMADSRLRVVNTITPRGSALSVIELQLFENSDNHIMGELI